MVVIPHYNHCATVVAVARACLAQHPHLVVVDDGSSAAAWPAVRAELERMGVALLRHERNRGKGAAVLTAARYAAGRGMSHIITIDADGQHLAEDIPAFIAAIAAKPLAVQVGRRDFAVANVPFSSRFGRAFSNFWLRVETGCRLGDVQSGFRAYPLTLLTQLDFSESGFAFEVEVLVRAAWAGLELCDVPVQVRYAPAAQRISHFDKWRDNLRLAWLNNRLCMRAMLPWPHRRLVPRTTAPFSWRRPLQSLRSLLAQDISPLRLGLATAVGIFLGALPLIACHTVVTLFVAGYVGVNRYLAVAAGNLCVPPLVPALCIEVGYYLRHGHWLTEVSFTTLGRECLQRLYEWFIGSLVVGPLLALLGGGLVFAVSYAMQQGAIRVTPRRGEMS